jgi:hypothetical protein
MFILRMLIRVMAVELRRDIGSESVDTINNSQ